MADRAPPTRKPLPPWKTALFGMLAVALGLAAALAVVETVLRFLNDPLLEHNLAMSRMMQYGGQVGMVLTPNLTVSYHLPTGEAEHTIRINPQGYRMDGPLSEQPGPGVHRILALGDSMTFGLGVEGDRAYPARLEQILRTREPGGGFAVINAGFASGICPLPQFLYLRNRGLRLAPRTVIVGFFPVNDIKDMAAFQEITGDDGIPEGALTRGQRVPHCIKRTALYQYFGILHLKHFIVSIRGGKGPPRPAARNGAATATGPEGFDRVKDSFLAMQMLAQQNRARLVLLYLPAYSELYGEGWENLEPVRKAFLAFCEDRGIDCLDLTQALRDAGPDCYFPLDRHFTEKGHRVVAEGVAGYLLSQHPDAP